MSRTKYICNFGRRIMLFKMRHERALCNFSFIINEPDGITFLRGQVLVIVPYRKTPLDLLCKMSRQQQTKLLIGIASVLHGRDRSRREIDRTGGSATIEKICARGSAGRVLNSSWVGARGVRKIIAPHVSEFILIKNFK